MTRLLVVRLGSMGDIVHTLPAAASLKSGYPDSHLTWLVEAKWRGLLEGNPYVDEIAVLDRGGIGAIARSLWRLRRGHYDLAVDFQGLLKSAIPARISGAGTVHGFAPGWLRESGAAWFYGNTASPQSTHVVDLNLDLAESAGAARRIAAFPLPPGLAEDTLPDTPFVLANPLAGWGAKQWPLDRYGVLATRLRRECGLALVVNGPPGQAEPLRTIPNVWLHLSGLPGLLDATRRAEVVLGIDSGPLHIAAALAKPGVAVFGPTNPERNGPYGGTVEVLRAPGAATSYRREANPAPSMCAIQVDEVLEALKGVLSRTGRQTR